MSVKAPAPPPTPPSLRELVTRMKPLTGQLPECIVRAQSSAHDPVGWVVPHCGSHSAPAWFCAETHFRCEFRALLDLSKQGLVPYVPMMLIQRRPRVEPGRPHVDCIEPIFPGYVFVQFNRATWRRANGAEGVRAVMMGAGETPLFMRGAEIRSIQSRGRAGDGIIDTRTDAEKARSAAAARRSATAKSIEITYFPPIAVGAPVKITSGPFADIVGICRLSEANRLVLMTSMFGGSEVELRRNEVEAL